jgi:transposase
LIFVDESGIDNKCSYRKYGWSKRGERIYTNDLTGKYFIRTSIIGALRNKEPIALLSFIGTTDTEMFEFWVENCLCLELTEGDVVIMDSARIHKSEKTRKLIESKGAMLKFQPPYSPFLNKIENYWSFLKTTIRNSAKNFDNFKDCVDWSFKINYGSR